MSKYRQAAKVDANQGAIVKALRDIAGVSVEVGYDDILVGYKGKTYWYELKDPEKVLNVDGTYRKGAIKPDQYRLLETYTGHYKIVHSLDMILQDIGIM